MIESKEYQNTEGRFAHYYVKTPNGITLYVITVEQKIVHSYLEKPTITGTIKITDYISPLEGYCDADLEQAFTLAIQKQKEWHLDTDKKAEIETTIKISDWE